MSELTLIYLNHTEVQDMLDAHQHFLSSHGAEGQLADLSFTVIEDFDFSGLELERLVGALQGGGVPNLLTMGLNDASLARLADPAILQEIENVANMQSMGKLTGLGDWIRFNALKASNELDDAAVELKEAQRLANENPGSVIRVGREVHAPTRPGTTEKMPEFDLSVEDVGGATQRAIEMKTIQQPVSQVSELTPGVRHAADKVLQRINEGDPIPGFHDATISMKFDVGVKNLRGGMKREIFSMEQLELLLETAML